MNVLRGLALTTVSGAMLLGPVAGANAASDPAATTGGKAAVTCRIQAGAPYLGGGRIKGDGTLTCSSDVAALQMKVTIQKRVGARWVNIGTPAQGTRYNVYQVYGTAWTGYFSGIYRTKSTGKVLFYGSSTWRNVQAVSGPRSA